MNKQKIQGDSRTFDGSALKWDAKTVHFWLIIQKELNYKVRNECDFDCDSFVLFFFKTRQKCVISMLALGCLHWSCTSSYNHNCESNRLRPKTLATVLKKKKNTIWEVFVFFSFIHQRCIKLIEFQINVVLLNILLKKNPKKKDRHLHKILRNTTVLILIRVMAAKNKLSTSELITF